jgi:hypothetical protein
MGGSMEIVPEAIWTGIDGDDAMMPRVTQRLFAR